MVLPTATVTVTKVVPQEATLLEETAAELVAATATSVELSAVVVELEAPPKVEAAAFVPSTATAVKLEKP